MPKVSRKRKYGRRYKPYGKSRVKAGARWTPDEAAGAMPALSVPRGVNGFPTDLRTTLKYSDVITLTSTGNAVASYVFRMNSLFDPDFSGTGHQPYYFDQLAALYSRYCVIGSKLTATFTIIPNSVDGAGTSQPNGPLVCAVWGDPTNTSTSTLQTIMETNTSKSGILGTATGGYNHLSLSTTYSPETKLGVVSGDDTVCASVANSPSQAWYGTIAVCDVGLAAATSVSVKIDMNFRVRFFQQNDISGS